MLNALRSMQQHRARERRHGKDHKIARLKELHAATFFTARNLAERERGFSESSFSDAVSALRVNSS
jgi:hypothetical protein